MNHTKMVLYYYLYADDRDWSSQNQKETSEGLKKKKRAFSTLHSQTNTRSTKYSEQSWWHIEHRTLQRTEIVSYRSRFCGIIKYLIGAFRIKTVSHGMEAWGLRPLWLPHVSCHVFSLVVQISRHPNHRTGSFHSPDELANEVFTTLVSQLYVIVFIYFFGKEETSRYCFRLVLGF